MFILKSETIQVVVVDPCFVKPIRYKRGLHDPTYDNGYGVSISVLPHDPAIQIRTIGVQWLHEEEGNDEPKRVCVCVCRPCVYVSHN